MLRRISLLLAALAGVLATALVASEGAHAGVESIAPERVLDTRIGFGARRGQLRPGEVLRLDLDVDGSGGTSVLLNLTSDQAARPGFVSAWSCADPAPSTSILNVFPGRAIPNMVALAYTDAGLCFSASAPVHLIADLTAVATDGDLVGARPHRVLDTRESRPYVGGREYRVRIGGVPGIPTGAVAAAMNITVVGPTAPGNVLVKPCGRPSDASSINYLTGEVVPHFTFSALTNGEVCITSTATTHLIVDTFAWMPADSELQLISPQRLLDTRNGTGGTFGAIRDGQLVRLRVAGRSGVPNDAAGATVNVVAVGGAAFGFVAIWPCDRAQPNVSTLNLWPGVVRANQATITLSQPGELCLRAKIVDSSRLHLVVDAVGYSEGSVDRPPPPPPPSGRFATLPVGAALPSGAECAARVRPAPEIRPANAVPNANRGSRANANGGTLWEGLARVDGAFAGTTDEIMQWAACKWGIDEDMVRAQIIKESWWNQSNVGDGGDSWGMGQVRMSAHPSAFEFAAVNARNSSAYNLDYTYAIWRGCFEGRYGWLNDFERGRDYAAGDAWGCLGLWFSGRWYWHSDAYLNQPGDSVRWHYENRTWEESWFIDG